MAEIFAPSVFQVECLTKVYAGLPPVEANRDISLTIEVGTIWGIFGPNGAGKTTLVRQMLGLLRPTSGRVLLNGDDVTRRADMIARTVGYLPQGGQALYDFTAEEALYFTGRLRGLGRREAGVEVERLAEEWQLAPLLKRVVRYLSGGQQRLIGLVSILVGSPQALVLDEPTNFMDPALRRQVWDHLLCLNRDQGVTVVLVTHNVLEAETVVSRVAIIAQGRLLVQGPPAQLRAGLGDQVHLDLSWRNVTPEAEALMAELGFRPRQLDSYRWRLTVTRFEADEVVQRLLGRTSLQSARLRQDLVDVRLHGASLEDYYLAVTGGNSQAQEEAP
jgi:ABC-type multidrug transport system ATPase subunit